MWPELRYNVLQCPSTPFVPLNPSNYAMPVHPHAYVRPARPSEAPIITDILTRAFLNDPAMSYYGVVTALVKDPANPTPAEQKNIRALHVFQGTMLKIPILTGGNVDVVVIPRDPDNSTSKQHEGESEAEEQIIGASLWLPPGVTLDLSLWTILRAGAWKVAFTWGLTSVKVQYPFISLPTGSSKAYGVPTEAGWRLHDGNGAKVRTRVQGP